MGGAFHKMCMKVDDISNKWQIIQPSLSFFLKSNFQNNEIY